MILINSYLLPDLIMCPYKAKLKLEGITFKLKPIIYNLDKYILNFNKNLKVIPEIKMLLKLRMNNSYYFTNKYSSGNKYKTHLQFEKILIDKDIYITTLIGLTDITNNKVNIKINHILFADNINKKTINNFMPAVTMAYKMIDDDINTYNIYVYNIHTFDLIKYTNNKTITINIIKSLRSDILQNKERIQNLTYKNYSFCNYCEYSPCK